MMKKIPTRRNYLVKWTKNIFLILLIGCIPVFAKSQDLDARSPKPSQGSHQQRKAEIKKEKQKQKLEKAITKGKKRHLSYQEKETKRMMRKSKRKAKKWNKN